MQLGIASWEGRLAPVFDTADRLTLINLESGQEPVQRSVPLSGDWPVQRAQAVLEQGVQVLLCGAISRPAAILLQSAGVQVQAWLRGPIEQIVEAFVSGQLGNDEHIMPFGRGGPGRQNQGGRGQGKRKGQGQGQGKGEGRGNRGSGGGRG